MTTEDAVDSLEPCHPPINGQLEAAHGHPALRNSNERPCSLLHHFCILRNDLPPGVAFAQLIHAAGFSALDAPQGHLPPGTYAIALQVPDELALVELERRLQAGGVPHIAVRESDAPYTGQLMAIGLAPAPKAKLKKYLSSLKLAGK